MSGTDLVYGLGATGMSIARYLQRSDGNAIFIDSRDEPPGLDELRELWPDVDVRPGETKLPGNVERVIVSPGIPDSDELLAKARKKKLEVLSDIELFAREAKAPFAAVTGSNGKSTVTTLLYHMCRADGRKVLAGGNLGEPALDLLAEGHPGYLCTRVVELPVAAHRDSARRGCGVAQCVARPPRLAHR